jgi:hypothetical protein
LKSSSVGLNVLAASSNSSRVMIYFLMISPDIVDTDPPMFPQRTSPDIVDTAPSTFLHVTSPDLVDMEPAEPDTVILSQASAFRRSILPSTSIRICFASPVSTTFPSTKMEPFFTWIESPEMVNPLIRMLDLF